MLHIIYNVHIFKKFFSVLLTGIVIKMMDDYIDEESDYIQKKFNVAVVLKKGVLPYGMLALSFAFFLEPSTSLTLFLSSFAVGMALDLTAKMPSGLYGYQESLIVIISGLIFFKIDMLSSLLLITFIQLFDDFLDNREDKSNKRNIAFLVGNYECLMLSIIFLLLSLYFDFQKSLLTIFSFFIINYIINLWLTNTGKFDI